MAQSWRHPRFTKQSGELSMTAMIDVVFLLLIFFVCTASFQAVEMVLPSSLLVSSSATVDVPIEPPEDLERIVVVVAGDASRVRWLVNDQPCDSIATLTELLGAIASVDASLPVVVDCGDAVPLAQAIEVYDLARSLGLSKVQFAADAP
ncbi:ExbD/TolR family protein [Aeoliella mucimassa]|uniref:Biopolymer transport protein ExbD/TolR n=1 Tax=Aeoliella mucimassa TaxID=2527972 RepID=A0A518AHX8_9BACT|nr:biopolymer transporter ExbD [Aeoliella mucimassa]QDU54336.1 Biopolymer transport protein ExbD/TolR [Aeoliella mucimassa]